MARGYVVYSPELGARICEEMSSGESVASICKNEWAPSEKSVYLWLVRHAEFAKAYEAALAGRCHKWASEIVDLADGCTANRDGAAKARVQIDARKWVLSKLMPKVYGDMVDVKHTGDVSVTIKRFAAGLEPGKRDDDGAVTA